MPTRNIDPFTALDLPMNAAHSESLLPHDDVQLSIQHQILQNQRARKDKSKARTRFSASDGEVVLQLGSLCGTTDAQKN
jgi:hypothetical protein